MERPAPQKSPDAETPGSKRKSRHHKPSLGAGLAIAGKAPGAHQPSWLISLAGRLEPRVRLHGVEAERLAGDGMEAAKPRHRPALPFDATDWAANGHVARAVSVAGNKHSA